MRLEWEGLMRAHKLAAIVLMLTLLNIPEQANTQDVAGALTLGVVLDHLADRLANLISQAGAEFRTSTYAASGQVNNLIDNARTAYHDELNETKDKWDETVKTTVDQVGATLDAIERHAQDDIDKDLNKIELIETNLPLSDKTPRLSDQQPYLKYVAGPFLVTFTGNFPYASDPQFAPTLAVEDKLGGKKTTLSPSLVTLTEMQFQLTPGILPDTDVTTIRMATLKLSVPYKTNCVLGWCFASATSEFPSYLGSLPPIAGHVKVTDSHVVSQTVVETRTSSTIGMNSQGCCDRGPSPVCDPAAIPGGWRYVPNSAHMIDLDEHGGRKQHQWDEQGPVVSTNVCWQVQTWQHRLGRDGNVSFKIQYQLAHDVNSDVNTNLLDVDIAWNSSRVIQIDQNTRNWVVDFKPFDGPAAQFAREGVSTPPYLTIGTPSASQLQLIVAPPPEIR
jgi:hypothetical protein